MYLICCEVYFTEVDFSNTLSVIFFFRAVQKNYRKKYKESIFNNKIPSDSNLVQRYSVTFKVRLYDYCQIFQIYSVNRFYKGGLFSLEFSHKP